MSWVTGCVTPTLTFFQARRYRLDVDLRRAPIEWTAKATIDLEREKMPGGGPSGPVRFNLLLHRGLDIIEVRAGGATLAGWRPIKPDEANADPRAPRAYEITLQQPVDALTLMVTYAANKRRTSASRIGSNLEPTGEGVYLGEKGVYLTDRYWHPRLSSRSGEHQWVEYTLVARGAPGVDLIASAERDATLSERTGADAWRTPYPVDSIALVGGGPLWPRESAEGPLQVRCYWQSNRQGDYGLLDSTLALVRRYESLLGPFPSRELNVVESTIEKTFAAPGLMVLAPTVVDAVQSTGRVPDDLHHALIHAWLGSPGPDDEIRDYWCRVLSRYAATYHGRTSESDKVELRRIRRRVAHAMSRGSLPPSATGGSSWPSLRRDAAAFVLDSLSRKIGPDAFRTVTAGLVESHYGRPLSWSDLQRGFEQESGQSLQWFADQWLHSGRLPEPVIAEARYQTEGRELIVTLAQGEQPFDLDVPLRVGRGESQQEVTLHLSRSEQTFTLPMAQAPETVELDPDYLILRRVRADQIVPTTALSRSGAGLTTIVPEPGMPGVYERIQAAWESGFPTSERVAISAENVAAGTLTGRSLLVLGDAVHAPFVRGFLRAVDFPVRFDDKGFTLFGERYDGPSDAVLCTIRHPDRPEAGVTVCFGNSPLAMPGPQQLLAEDHSLVIFRSGQAIVRQDFETRHVVKVDVVGKSH